jgi:hypothetical protein
MLGLIIIIACLMTSTSLVIAYFGRLWVGLIAAGCGLGLTPVWVFSSGFPMDVRFLFVVLVLALPFTMFFSTGDLHDV